MLEIILLPPPYQPGSFELRKQYCDLLVGARRNAWRNPLAPRSKFSLYLYCKAKPVPASRSFPWLIVQGGPYSCELLYLLDGGDNSVAQVWAAQVLPPNSSVNEQEGTGSKIALKFFQQSL